MQIRHISMQQSPVAKDRIRISAEVCYDDRKFPAEICWYELPEQFLAGHTISGDPWLAAYLPLAMTLGEPLRISAPVDRTLFEGMQQALEIWHAWYPDLPIVPIEAEVADAPPLEEAGRTAAFFSGGVDSFFTLLRNTDPANARSVPIDDLLLVWGLERIAGSPVVQRYLRVCWRSGTDQICGQCGKCLRAMVALEVLGFRERCTTLPVADLNLTTIAKAIEHSLKRSLRLQRWSRIARSFHKKPLVWRWADWLERKVLAGSAR